MSVDISTQYLGLQLKNPLGVAACPALTGHLDSLRALEDAGAAVAVLPSLFEEQLVHDELEVFELYEYQAESFSESLSYFPEISDYHSGPSDYLDHLTAAKQAVTIPIIASLNGASRGGWVSYAKAMENAGADALELNIYFIPTDVTQTAADVEQRYVDLVADVRQSISIPLAVKIGQNFTSLPHFAQQLATAGADGLVLFNRYVEADIDLEALRVKPDLVLSNRHEARTPIRWIAILRDQLDISLAATSGIHRVPGIVKLLLAGADVTMMVSILLMKGSAFVATLLRELEEWLTENEYESVKQLKGSMSRQHIPDPSSFERANYMRALTKYSTQHPIPYAHPHSSDGGM